MNGPSGSVETPTAMKETRPLCPTCRREVALEATRCRPFCSERCRLVDLSGWLGERYRVPAEPLAPESESDGDEE